MLLQVPWTLLLSSDHELLLSSDHELLLPAMVLLWLLVSISREVALVVLGLGEVHIGSGRLVLEGAVRHLNRVAILLATWVYGAIGGQLSLSEFILGSGRLD